MDHNHSSPNNIGLSIHSKYQHDSSVSISNVVSKKSDSVVHVKDVKFVTRRTVEESNS